MLIKFQNSAVVVHIWRRYISYLTLSLPLTLARIHSHSHPRSKSLSISVSLSLSLKFSLTLGLILTLCTHLFIRSMTFVEDSKVDSWRFEGWFSRFVVVSHSRSHSICLSLTVALARILSLSVSLSLSVLIFSSDLWSLLKIWRLILEDSKVDSPDLQFLYI